MIISSNNRTWDALDTSAISGASSLRPLLVASFAIVTMLWPNAALADNAAPPQGRPFRPATADREFACEKLTQPVELPGVPVYTGRARFMSGLRYPNDRTGYRIGLTYAATEDESHILEWYKGALATYSWKMLNFSPEAKSITAVKDGNTFTVQITPNRVEGYRTVMVLSYKSNR